MPTGERYPRLGEVSHLSPEELAQKVMGQIMKARTTVQSQSQMIDPNTPSKLLDTKAISRFLDREQTSTTLSSPPKMAPSN
jgi:hypothetical protein